MTQKPEVKQCWQMSSIDITGPLPRSTKGNIYILVITNYLSKFSLFFTLKKTSTNISRILEDNIFLLFGTPEFLICANGKQFISKEFKSLLKEYNVTSIYNASYHPQTNPTKRVKRVLKIMIASYIKHNENRKWDIHLSKFGCAIRAAGHEIVQHTPYFINFGKKMVTNGSEYIYDRNKNKSLGIQDDDTDEIISKTKERLNKLRNFVKDKLAKSYEKTSKRYNLRHRPIKL